VEAAKQLMKIIDAPEKKSISEVTCYFAFLFVFGIQDQTQKHGD
jgi:hypothetical protein